MIDPFERMRYVKSFVQNVYPHLTHEDIKERIQNIVKFRNRTKKTINEQEQIIYDLLLQHEIMPATAYKWYKILNLPSYLQEDIRQRKISMTEAFDANLENNKTFEVLATELRKEILDYVNELAKKDFLRGDDYAIK